MTGERYDRDECIGCQQIAFLQEGTNPDEICAGCSHNLGEEEEYEREEDCE